MICFCSRCCEPCVCSWDRKAKLGSVCGKVWNMGRPATIFIFTIHIAMISLLATIPDALPRSLLKSCDGQLAKWSNGQAWKKQAQHPSMACNVGKIRHNIAKKGKKKTMTKRYKRVVNSAQFSEALFQRIGLWQKERSHA